MPRRKKPETYSAIVHRSSGNITAACLVFPAYAGVKLSQINRKLIQLSCLNSSKVPEYVFKERSGKSEFLKRMRGAGRALPGTNTSKFVGMLSSSPNANSTACTAQVHPMSAVQTRPRSLGPQAPSAPQKSRAAERTTNE